MPTYQVVKVWEWEDKDGEPHIRIERDGHSYDNINVAQACARTFNSCRSQATINAGCFYEVMTPQEIAITVQS